jgi:hypothetical protein
VTFGCLGRTRVLYACRSLLRAFHFRDVSAGLTVLLSNELLGDGIHVACYEDFFLRGYVRYNKFENVYC